MSNKEAGTMVCYRVVKAMPGHQFAGLYAVEKVYIKNEQIYKKQIVHEWDMRAFSEAALARLGGSAAYDAYIEDHDVQEDPSPLSKPAKARTAEELRALPKDALKKEITL